MSLEKNTPPGENTERVEQPAAAPVAPTEASETSSIDIEEAHPEESTASTGDVLPEGEKNFEQEAEWSSSAMPADKFIVSNETALLPSNTHDETRAVLESMPETPIGDDKKSALWFDVLNGGLSSLPYSDGLTLSANRIGSAYRQAVQSATYSLKGGMPVFKVKEGVKPTGESARFQIRANLGMGTVFMAPLWHSGFWMTLKTPGEGALLELYRTITAEKMTLGRSTYGFMFSNSTAYTSRILLDFVMAHMHESTFKEAEGEDVRSFIRVPDLPILIWAMACAVWPNGFQYQRACVTDPDKCKHVVSEKLNLSKLQWTDTTALTERQKTHMSSRTRKSVDSKSIERYVSEFIIGQNTTIKINDKLSMVMRIPTAIEHIDAGYKWVNKIEETYAQAMDQTPQQRDEFLVSQGKATAMRQYTHFVHAILSGDDEFTEREIIESTLDDLTSDDTIRTTFLDKAREFLDGSVISMVAIPTYKCPACGGEQHADKERPRHPKLIPLDVTQTFFQLLVQKVRRIEGR